MAPVSCCGAGLRSTRGLKAGVVVEMDGVEQAIRGAVSDAEAAAGVPISEVKLAVACGRLRAQTFAADAQISRHHVTPGDVERVLQAGAAFAEKDGRVLLDLESGRLSRRRRPLRVEGHRSGRTHARRRPRRRDV